MTVISGPDLLEAEIAGNRRQWLVSSAWLALIVAAMIAMFWEAAIGAYRVWRGSETFNHCFLIVPIVAYLVWDRRGVFSAMAPRPSPWLLALLPVPVLAWLVGDIGAVLELQQFAAITTLQVAIATVLGIAAYRALLFPCLYLFLLVPTGEWLTPPLQDLTTWFIVNGLELLSIPVFADGVFIDTPSGRFEVAEACAGLRFLIAAVAFGLLFANLIYRSRGRRVVFVALSFVVPVIANGLRAFGIVYIAYLSDNRIAVGVDHIVYGWGFFTAILLALIWIGLRYREDHGAHAANLPSPIATQLPAKQHVGIGLAALIVLAIVSLGPAYASYLHSNRGSPDRIALSAPDARPPWRAVPWTSSWRPVYAGATTEMAQAYSDTVSTVELLIAVYADQRQGAKLIGFGNRLEDGEVWRRVDDRAASLTLDGLERPALMRRLDGREGTRLVWWLYWVDGHWTTSGIAARVRYLLGKLIHGRSTAAVLVLGAAGPSEAAASAAAQRLLSSIPDLAAVLRESGRRQARS